MTEDASVEESRMPLVAHLAELRTRLISGVAAIGILTLACFSLSEELFRWLKQPLQDITGHQLIVLSPLEMFVTYLKLAIVAAIFLGSPWLLLQIWLFIAPGLYQNEKKWIIPFIILGTICFVGGGAFAFYVVMPLGFEYLVKMTPEFVKAQYSVAIYFSLVTRLLLAFGVVFELPLLMWILSAVGLVSPQQFSKLRKYWIVIAVALGAMLTPPDPFTQLMMAIPLVVFFELGILGSRFMYRDRSKPSEQPDKSAPV